jgi:hypothetical protein
VSEIGNMTRRPGRHRHPLDIGVDPAIAELRPTSGAYSI